MSDGDKKLFFQQLHTQTGIIKRHSLPSWPWKQINTAAPPVQCPAGGWKKRVCVCVCVWVRVCGCVGVHHSKPTVWGVQGRQRQKESSSCVTSELQFPTFSCRYFNFRSTVRQTAPYGPASICWKASFPQGTGWCSGPNCLESSIDSSTEVEQVNDQPLIWDSHSF